MNDCVDVIVPTFKRPELLDRVIESIQNQSYKNVRITIVDDNDPNSVWREKTIEIMDKYQGLDYIQYIQHDRNRNGSAARNTGLQNTNGGFVCFLDDDDYYLKDKIQLQLEYLTKHKDMAACYCDFERNNTNIYLPNKVDFSYEILLGLPAPQTSGIMFRRDVLEKLHGFDETYYRHQDYELLLRFYDYFSMGKVEKVLYIRDKSKIDNCPNGEEFEKLKKKFLNQFSYKIQEFEKIERGFEKKVFINNYIQVCINYIKQRDFLESQRILWRCLQKNTLLTICILLEKVIHGKRR